MVHVFVVVQGRRERYLSHHRVVDLGKRWSSWYLANPRSRTWVVVELARCVVEHKVPRGIGLGDPAAAAKRCTGQQLEELPVTLGKPLAMVVLATRADT